MNNNSKIQSAVENEADRRKRWLDVIGYEVSMLRRLRVTDATHSGEKVKKLDMPMPAFMSDFMRETRRRIPKTRGLLEEIRARFPRHQNARARVTVDEYLDEVYAFAESMPLMLDGQRETLALFNALAESQVLHARNLCDFCTPPWQKDDIKPSDLFNGYYAADEYSSLMEMTNNVATEYRKDMVSVRVFAEDGTSSNQLKSPRWAFNKKLAHPTKTRTDSFDYTPFLNLVVPKIELLASEIERLEIVHGRNFRQFFIQSRP